MEYINKVELQGRVGSCRIQEVNGQRMARFSLYTEHARKDKDGTTIYETLWLNVSAFEGEAIDNVERIKKGSCAYLIGRIRLLTYMSSDDTERTFMEVLASKVGVI